MPDIWLLAPAASLAAVLERLEPMGQELAAPEADLEHEATHRRVRRIGRISGGVRHNIIPDTVEMAGTIRVIEPKIHEDVRERVRRTARSIAEAAGATAEVEITPNAIVTYNDPELTRRMVPTPAAGGLRRRCLRVAAAHARRGLLLLPAARLPGVFFFLGINKDGVPAEEAAPNHSPLFYVNEASMKNGVRAKGAVRAMWRL